MGGFGSGRPSGSGRGTVEACRLIDASRLHKTGCLRAGWAGGWQWTRDGEKVASINLRTEEERLHPPTARPSAILRLLGLLAGPASALGAGPAAPRATALGMTEANVSAILLRQDWGGMLAFSALHQRPGRCSPRFL